MYSVSIIIPNFNGKHLLEKNLKHVLIAATSYQSVGSETVEVIVVDDCSTDESVAYLKSIAADSSLPLHIVEKKKNEGFAATVNTGVKKALGEIIVLCNTDAIPEKNFLKPLLLHFKNKEIFGVGCLEKSIEGERIVERGRGIGVWDKGLLIHAKGTDTKTNTLWISGGSCAIRRSLWNQLEGFRTLYDPFYWEDIDLSYQAQKRGYVVLFEKESVVKHMHEEGAIRKKFSDKHISTIAYRNQLLFAWINMTDKNLIKDHLLYLPYHFLTALLREDFPFLSGFFRAIIHLPKVLELRKRATPFIVKIDKEITAVYQSEMGLHAME